MPSTNREERLAEIDKKIDQMKAQKRAILNRQKESEKKARTHRLIEIGATMESALGITISKEMLPTLLELMSISKTKDFMVSKLLPKQISGNPEK